LLLLAFPTLWLPYWTAYLNRLRRSWCFCRRRDVVVGEGAAVLEPLAGEDTVDPGDPFLILDLLLHVADGVGGVDLQRDGLAGERLAGVPGNTIRGCWDPRPYGYAIWIS